MHRFVLTLLFLIVIISLNRDETWSLVHLPNEPLTKAEAEEIIDRYLSARTWIRCDCHAPTVECEEVCTQRDQVREICGTMMLRAETRIRQSIEAGSDPWDIAKLIAQHPDPFSKKYFFVYPGKKLQPISPLLPIPRKVRKRLI